eukprot:GAHX01000017.1.p1 GENE.GAHX01000017.1~~GAHX01000017.1.p1  ORF type:complete len:169 (+),score=48.58 GAHX01000017.1:32-508(+)
MLSSDKLTSTTKLLSIKELESKATLHNVFNDRSNQFDLSSACYLLNNKVYSAETEIGSLNISPNHEHLLIKLMIPVLGGKKKKDSKGGAAKKGTGEKKKTPKKILKHFKLTGKGVDTKVEYLKKDCKGLDCGVGFGFAQHKDKSICGKCGMVTKTKTN